MMDDYMAPSVQLTTQQPKPPVSQAYTAPTHSICNTAAVFQAYQHTPAPGPCTDTARTAVQPPARAQQPPKQEASHRKQRIQAEHPRHKLSKHARPQATHPGCAQEAIKAAGEEAISEGAADVEGRAPLHVAAAEGHAEAVQALLDAGAPINGRDGRNRTPLLVRSRTAVHDYSSSSCLRPLCSTACKALMP